jgi:hypothetical protein
LVLALMDETLVMRIEAERTLVHQLDHWQGGHINQGLHQAVLHENLHKTSTGQPGKN